jgi:hypothetical protein
MLPTQIFSSIQQLALNQRQLVKGVTDVAPVNTRFEIGQKMQGHVLTQIASGIFHVRVANQTVQMPLTHSVRAGDMVDLEVVALQPRLTFNMSASSNPLSAPESLSTAARLFSSLTQQEPERALVRAAPGQALWMGGLPPDSPQLAGRLAAALCQSGLFYESHQVQWLAGKRSTAELLEEPQNLLLRQQDKPDRETGSATPSPAETAARDTPQTSASSPLQQLVQQQLNALNSGQVVWQGQVWEGQEVQWEIHEESGPNQDGENERHWVTQIHLDLPNLGEVSAQLTLTGGGLLLRVETATEQTRKTLGTASPQLISSLHEQGITVLDTQVARHESAG